MNKKSDYFEELLKLYKLSCQKIHIRIRPAQKSSGPDRIWIQFNNNEANKAKNFISSYNANCE
jgi:hypothetical protein